MIAHVVSADDAGRRLDALVRRLGALSQQQARQLCALGAVAIDGVRQANAALRLREGAQVAFDPDAITLSLQLGLPVAFHDPHLVVLHKPPGLAVHAGPLVTHSVAAALETTLPGAGLCHRLDREASGLLLVGRTPEALRTIGAAMEHGDVARSYQAVVVGEPTFDERVVELPLRVTDEPRGDRPKTVVADDGQPSHSHIRVLARHRGTALVAVRITTGRTHQIRAHLRAIDHPILGDPRYGDATANERARATFGVRRTLLHAAELRFAHPTTGAEVLASAMREPDLARLFPKP